MITQQLTKLFDRDINKLKSEILQFKNEDDLWRTMPGVKNSAGNLCLHLVGNLQAYIGRNIGSIPFVRDRDAEFSLKGILKADLVSRVEHTFTVVHNTVSNLQLEKLEEVHIENILGYEMTNAYFLFHLLAHLSYHTGQINYIRRIIEPADQVLNV